MDVCVVLLYKDSSMEHERQKDLKVQNGSKEKTGQGEKKSRRGHRCLCCVCCTRTSMDHKWHEEGRKDLKVQNVSKGNNGTGKKNPATGMDICFFVSVLCCQVEVSASGWSLVQRSSTECGVSEGDREATMMRRPRPTRGCCTVEYKHYID
jgi:hypothetical protein